jgi:hypothetical protein
MQRKKQAWLCKIEDTTHKISTLLSARLRRKTPADEQRRAAFASIRD